MFKSNKFVYNCWLPVIFRNVNILVYRSRATTLRQTLDLLSKKFVQIIEETQGRLASEIKMEIGALRREFTDSIKAIGQEIDNIHEANDVLRVDKSKPV